MRLKFVSKLSKFRMNLFVYKYGSSYRLVALWDIGTNLITSCLKVPSCIGTAQIPVVVPLNDGKFLQLAKKVGDVILLHLHDVIKFVPISHSATKR